MEPDRIVNTLRPGRLALTGGNAARACCAHAGRGAGRESGRQPEHAAGARAGRRGAFGRRGHGDGGRHRFCGACRAPSRPALRRISAEPDSSAVGRVWRSSAAGDRHRHPRDSHERGTQAWRAHESDRHPLLLLAGPALAEDVSVTVLHAENVSFDIAGRSLVSDIDLACESGQFVALLGANGAGKSTLIRMLSGLERPSRGQVRLAARPIRAIARRVLARRRAYIPQNARVEWPVDVERRVALGLLPQLPVFGDLDSAAWRKVEAALALCDLSHKTCHPATTLSGV